MSKTLVSTKSNLDRVIRFLLPLYSGHFLGEGNVPYIVHVFDMLSLLCNEWCITDRDIWKASLCHDLCWTGQPPQEKIIKAIGQRAYEIFSESVENRSSHNWQEVEDKSYLESCYQKSIPALFIILASLCTNTLDLFTHYPPERARNYWRSMSEIFGVILGHREKIIEEYGMACWANLMYSKSQIEDLVN